MCAFTGIFWKRYLLFLALKKSQLFRFQLSVLHSFVKGFGATLPTAIYGIQSLEGTFSPGSDFSNGKTHKMSSEQHMHNVTFERQSLENSDSYYLSESVCDILKWV